MVGLGMVTQDLDEGWGEGWRRGSHTDPSAQVMGVDTQPDPLTPHTAACVVTSTPVYITAYPSHTTRLNTMTNTSLPVISLRILGVNINCCTYSMHVGL